MEQVEPASTVPATAYWPISCSATRGRSPPLRITCRWRRPPDWHEHVLQATGGRGVDRVRVVESAAPPPWSGRCSPRSPSAAPSFTYAAAARPFARGWAGPAPPRPAPRCSIIVAARVNRMSGLPCIRDTRVTVSAVLGQLAAGLTIRGLLVDFVYLDRADVLAALEFAAAAVQERKLPLA